MTSIINYIYLSELDMAYDRGQVLSSRAGGSRHGLMGRGLACDGTLPPVRPPGRALPQGPRPECGGQSRLPKNALWKPWVFSFKTGQDGHSLSK
jgi:hypothetical protein